jgi:hypothetical protein
MAVEELHHHGELFAELAHRTNKLARDTAGESPRRNARFELRVQPGRIRLILHLLMDSRGCL